MQSDGGRTGPLAHGDGAPMHSCSSDGTCSSDGEETGCLAFGGWAGGDDAQEMMSASGLGRACEGPRLIPQLGRRMAGTRTVG